MKPPRREPELLPIPVIRALIAQSTRTLQTRKKNSWEWKAVSLGRFAVWAAALEGAVDLTPEVITLARLIEDGNDANTFADFQGPLDALTEVVTAESEEGVHAELARHPSARARQVLADKKGYRALLKDDPDPAVRTTARMDYLDQVGDPPWWRGVLKSLPADVPALLSFGKVIPKLRERSDWESSKELANALNALPKDLAGVIAPRFLSSTWCLSTWTDAAWLALARSPLPVRERASLMEEVVARLVTETPFVETAHIESADAALKGCSDEERTAFEPLVERLRARREPPSGTARNAPWSPVAWRPRKALRPLPARAVKVPPTTFARLVLELASPTAWGSSRFAQHPRARFELARGLDVLRAQGEALYDAGATARSLADILSICAEERPTATEAMVLSVAGLLRCVDRDDPILDEVARDASAILREALALSEVGDEPRRAWPLLAAPEPQVWMAARLAATAAEPWRGPLATDPFEGCLPDEAAALVPTVVALDAALPRVRFETLEDDDFTRLARVATEFPGRIACELARRLLPVSDLSKKMAPIAAALLAAEGGWATWVPELERRLAKSVDVGTWFGGSFVRFAVLAAAAPSDGGAPLPWSAARRRDAANDALLRHERAGGAEKLADMWLFAATTLWSVDDDPFPLPGVWRGKYPSYYVSDRLKEMTLRPEWRVTQMLMEGVRKGFGDPWRYLGRVVELLDKLPAGLRLEAALEGFSNDDDFGEWSRAVLEAAIAERLHAGPAALATFLSDPRLAREHLVGSDRLALTLFILRARLVAGLADLSEALQTLLQIALTPKAAPRTGSEVEAWRARWVEAIETVMSDGGRGLRGVFVTLAPPGLWEPIDRSFVHAVASDATDDEARAIARRLALCGDRDDLEVARSLAARFPESAPWPVLLRALSERATG